MGCGASNRNNLMQKSNIKDKALFIEAFYSDFKDVKGLVIDDNTDFVNQKPISQNNNNFMEELVIYGDESDSVSPWVANIIQPNTLYEEVKTQVKIEIKPAHIFGYRCMDCRGNIYFLDDFTIVYHTGAFGIVQSIKTKSQKIFGGNRTDDGNCHTNDIVSIGIYKGEVSMVATGQLDAKPYIIIWSPYDPTVIYAKLYQDLGSKTVMNINFDSQGKYLVSLGRDEMNCFYIFDIQSKSIIWREITGSDILFDVKFSPVNSNEICIVGVNSVFFCSLETKEKMNHAKNMKKYKNTTFTCVEYSENGEKVITATSNGLLVIWTANKENSNLKDICEIKVSNCSILNMKISESSKKIICTDSNKKVYIIDPDSFLNTIEMKIQLDSDVKGIDINSKEKLLIGMADGKIVVKNIKSGRLREISYSHSSGRLQGLEFISPYYIVTTGQDNKIMLFNLNTYKLEGFSVINERSKSKPKTPAQLISPDDEYSDNQRSQCVCHNKTYDHIVIGLDNGTISIRKSIKNISLKFIDDLTISEKSITRLKFSPNDNFLVVLSDDGLIRILKVEDKYAIFKIFDDVGGVPLEVDWDTTSCYFQINNSNFEYFIYKVDYGKINNYNDPELKKIIWATQSCRYGYLVQGIYRGLNNDNFIRSVERSNNNFYLAVGNDDNLLEIFNYPCISESNKPKSYYGHCDPIENIKFNQDDSKIITVGGPDKSIVIWDVYGSQKQ